MNQEKIGKFIASCRKKQKLTQEQLAEKLGITYKAVSKWETGKGLPDASIMKDLCNNLKITVNELLSGELINKEDYNKRAEEYMLEIYRQKEEGDRRLLKLEKIVGFLFVTYFIFILLTMNYLVEKNIISENMFLFIVIISLVYIVVMGSVLLKVEQIAGYYECGKCHNKYIPTYKSVNLAPHLGRTRYMKCPKCNKKSWNKKVLSIGDKND
jgi:transcriptional regulator with XRE-family HTH domain/DNA-directed RNA polymerase subunit RPC12/RpoP